MLSIYTDKACRVQTLSDSGSVQELVHEDLDFSKESGLSDDALAALGICDVSENRHRTFLPTSTPTPPRPTLTCATLRARVCRVCAVCVRWCGRE